jgi:hypothetical protein
LAASSSNCRMETKGIKILPLGSILNYPAALQPL